MKKVEKSSSDGTNVEKRTEADNSTSASLSPNPMLCEVLPFTHVLQTIELIRTSFNGSEIVYMQGSCVKFAMILKHIYPTGKILYDLDHAIFEYEGKYFDINGFAKHTKNHIPIEDYGILSAHNSMNLKYKLNEKEKSKVITRLVRTIDKYWQQKDISKVIHFVNRLKTVAECVV